MENLVHIFKLILDWKLVGLISKIDRFDASWSSIEKKESQSLKQLKSLATVRSVGASTRIEGSRMSDEEVEVLLKRIDITKLSDRDSQEVVGYFETLDIITDSFEDIKIKESSIKNLHNILMKHSEKDEWHKGDYKQHTNAVEASYPDGTKQIIFKTTEAGIPTQDAMRALVDWYENDNVTHPLVKSALFAYEFVSVHPFQDGNGRVGRLLLNFILLKHNYPPINILLADRGEYYYTLQKWQNEHELRPTIEFLIKQYKRTLKQVTTKN